MIAGPIPTTHPFELPEGALLPPEFPGARMSSGPVASRTLESLVHHRHTVDHRTTLEMAYREFSARGVDFMAVVRAGRCIGLCSRGQIGFVMGSRFGFALYSHNPVDTVLVERALIVRTETPVHDVLERAFARTGDEFHEDVVLVDGHDCVLGLIKVESLARLQSQLVAEQVAALRRQHETLRIQNLELFQTNHALRQSRGLYQGLFESNALGVALLDPAGNVQACNRRLAELLNLPPEPAAGLSFVDWIAEGERPAFRGVLSAHERGGAGAGPAVRELIFEVPGRGPRRFRVTTGWIAETGQVCACLDDVTEQRALEQLMVRQEKQNLLDTLVGGIAHELNNKLTPVLGFAELLHAQSAEKTRTYTAGIRQSVEEAAHIIRQLLQLAKPAQGNLRAIDLRRLVEESLMMLRFPIREARCVLDTRLPANAVWVHVDAAQVKQVLMNLVLNALQAMQGRAEPRLELCVSAENGRACCAVADNGCGIAPGHLARIFDPFFTTKGPDKGTGLGLSISDSLVRQHGGELSVESAPGQGARFTMVLPLHVPSTPVLFLDAPEVTTVAESPHAAASEVRLRVLIVEDEDVVRSVLQEMLRAHRRCRIEPAANGADALALLEKDADFDLILSDIRMPVMNGTAFYQQLLEVHPALARRFVFVTGHAGSKALEDEIAGWGVPVLAKPFTLARLVAVCGPYLESAVRLASV